MQIIYEVGIAGTQPILLKKMNELGLQVISRMVNNDKNMELYRREKTLDGIYNKFKKLKSIKMSQYGKKQSLNTSTIVEHKNLVNSK